jgi:hypothetical protein
MPSSTLHQLLPTLIRQHVQALLLLLSVKVAKCNKALGSAQLISFGFIKGGAQLFELTLRVTRHASALGKLGDEEILQNGTSNCKNSMILLEVASDIPFQFPLVNWLLSCFW